MSLVYYPNFIGGAEVAIKEITDRLGDNFEFDMVTLRLDAHLPKVERIGNVTIHRVGWTGSEAQKVSPDSLPKFLHFNKFAMPLTAYIKAFSLYRKHKHSIVWSMMATYNSFASLFLKYTFPKIKFLLTLQEGDPIPYIKQKARFVWPIFKRVFTKADTIQAISTYLADFGHDMGATCPTVVVPNAVDMDRFTKEYSREEIEEVKNKLGKKEGDIFLITTSRLVSKNAVGDIINALPLVPPNVKLVIAGRGYQEESLRKQVKMLGIENRVQFIGWLSHSDMPKYLKASDIFIRVPISEGFGNSYVEAMAAGLPCIATPVGGITDFLKDRETGIFAEVRNKESVANAILELVRNEELVSKIRRQAFDMVKEKYDWNIIADDMKKVFLNI